MFEQLTVFENLELASGRRPVIPENAARPHHGRATQENRRGSRHHRPLRAAQDAWEEYSSHGQKQWLEIGMLLMQNPELLLVDEPVAGMTPHEIERTAELLLSLAGEHSVVVVEHDMAFVRSIARRVTVLARRPACIAEGDMDKVQNDPRVIEVYLGA